MMWNLRDFVSEEGKMAFLELASFNKTLFGGILPVMSVVSSDIQRLSSEQIHDQLAAIIGEQPVALKLVEDKCYVYPNFEVDPEAQVQLWLCLVRDVFPRVNFKLNIKRKLFEFIYRFRYVCRKWENNS